MRDNTSRILTLRLVVCGVFLLLLGRVLYLQISDLDYLSLSQSNVLRSVVLYPTRGEVLDRNGEYIVQSRGCYDLMVTYRELSKEGFDTIALCDLLNLNKERLVASLNRARMRPRVPHQIVNFVSMEDRLRFNELGIAGFHSVYRTVRQYPRKIGGNLLGHIGEVSAAQLRRDDRYAQGDYVGIGGVESAYEDDLRGEKGLKMTMVNNYGVKQGDYMDGLYDVPPQHGRQLTSTIDARLQLFGEELMQGKVGAAVAIEPSTGEILMMVSSPTFDPDELVGRERGNNYMKLLNDPRRPLYNRAVTSRYPPGSIFKMVQGLIGLQEGVLNPRQHYDCYGGFSYGTKELKCHYHAPHTSLVYAVSTSCNTYFCHVFCNILRNPRFTSIEEAYDSWRDYVMSFGFGRKLDSDFLSEGVGYVPKSEYYDRVYRGSWNPYTVISLSIGQGELGCTPLQMANLAAIIANRGYYYPPHIIRSVEGDSESIGRYATRQYTMVDSIHYGQIVQGMWESVNRGGSSTLARLDGYDVCGKTGTAQNPHGEDHSTFISFAPRDNPRIAISVYVENGGWGGTVAVPIASLIEEMYLTGEVKRERLVKYVKELQIKYPIYDNQNKK